MKLRDYIKALRAIRDEHGGDLEVETHIAFNRARAQLPRVAYRKVLTTRESKPRFYNEVVDPADSKGEKVVMV